VNPLKILINKLGHKEVAIKWGFGCEMIKITHNEVTLQIFLQIFCRDKFFGFAHLVPVKALVLRIPRNR